MNKLLLPSFSGRSSTGHRLRGGVYIVSQSLSCASTKWSEVKELLGSEDGTVKSRFVRIRARIMHAFVAHKGNSVFSN